MAKQGHPICSSSLSQVVLNLPRFRDLAVEPLPPVRCIGTGDGFDGKLPTNKLAISYNRCFHRLTHETWPVFQSMTLPWYQLLFFAASGSRYGGHIFASRTSGFGVGESREGEPTQRAVGAAEDGKMSLCCEAGSGPICWPSQLDMTGLEAVWSMWAVWAGLSRSALPKTWCFFTLDSR